MEREDGAAVGLQRTAAAEGWRRRVWPPLTKSDLSRTGDDLRSEAEAIAMSVVLVFLCRLQNLISLSLSL
ncbi:hypothetical protein, partial [Pleomorphochaeta sp. DL1XJH-081]|uniref:hypothetical protein n=1 Tax=Pleomorphochaeta sp. DL1XJH-081 TaxID=3409690 RepID=UPI003BB724F3